MEFKNTSENVKFLDHELVFTKKEEREFTKKQITESLLQEDDEKKVDRQEKQETIVTAPEKVPEAVSGYVQKKFADKALQDGHSEKAVKREIRELKKEILQEGVNDKRDKEDLFSDSSRPVFSEGSRQFRSREEDSFREEGKDASGKEKFVTDREKKENGKSITGKTVKGKRPNDALGEKIITKTILKKKETEAAGKTLRKEQPERRKQAVFMTKEERLKKLEENRTAAGRNKKHDQKRAAVVAVSRKLKEMKKKGDMGEPVTDDLLKAGRPGILTVFTDGIKDIGKLIGKKMMKLAGSVMGVFFVPMMIAFAFLLLIAGTVSVISGATSEEGESYVDGVYVEDGDGKEFHSLSQSDIDAIIESLYASYNHPERDVYDMGATQEKVLRYALSKVGCRYSQDYHSSLTADIFDCSSLAYRAYRHAGINIALNGLYSAAAECEKMEKDNKAVSDYLIPGDLVFWGGKDNGRYKGVYHVAIYVGNGKIVEAYGTSKGVIYGDLRNHEKIVLYARPI